MCGSLKRTGKSIKKNGDVIVWLEKVGAYLRTDPSLEESRKVDIASSLLEGDASEFWMSVVPGLRGEGDKEISFEIFTETLLQQYSEAFRKESAAEELLNLKEVKGKYDEYRRSFDLLVSKLPPDTKACRECMLVAQFRKGLHRSTAALVTIYPATGSKHTVLRDLQKHAKIAADMVAADLKSDLQILQGKASGKQETPRVLPAKRKIVGGATPKNVRPSQTDVSVYVCHTCGKP